MKTKLILSFIGFFGCAIMNELVDNKIIKWVWFILSIYYVIVFILTIRKVK